MSAKPSSVSMASVASSNTPTRTLRTRIANLSYTMGDPDESDENDEIHEMIPNGDESDNELRDVPLPDSEDSDDTPPRVSSRRQNWKRKRTALPTTTASSSLILPNKTKRPSGWRVSTLSANDDKEHELMDAQNRIKRVCEKDFFPANPDTTPLAQMHTSAISDKDDKTQPRYLHTMTYQERVQEDHALRSMLNKYLRREAIQTLSDTPAIAANLHRMVAETLFVLSKMHSIQRKAFASMKDVAETTQSAGFSAMAARCQRSFIEQR